MPGRHILFTLTVFPALLARAAEPTAPDYNRDVRPILADHCFACHGMDEKARKGDLRLDDRDAALKAKAFLPGDADSSELIKRLTAHDADDLMPPAEHKRPMTPEKIETLRRWVAAGAPYAPHWAFIPPAKSEVPTAPTGARVHDPVDAFVTARLAQEGLTQAPEASREVWLRRASFDLTGLPPSLEEMDAFLNDKAADAYERAADRLLASRAFGERMAGDWLDTARYGDTYGRHEDADCVTWPYRDWVIKAFNENLPYDQFILDQTAGDLLPNPTRDQMIATCFNRLPQQSNEAGSIPEEFRIEQVADRVHTNGTAFLGMTFECARCHDHKFDPVSTRDYYSMASFFNNIDELGLFCVYTGGTPPPSILVFTPEKETAHNAAVAEVARLEAEQNAMRPAAAERFAEWLKTNRPPKGDPWITQTRKAGAKAVLASPAQSPAVPVIAVRMDTLNGKKLHAEGGPKAAGAVRNTAKLVEGRVGQAVHMDKDNSVRMDGVPTFHRTDPLTIALWIRSDEAQTRGVLVHRSRAGIDAASRGTEIVMEDGHVSFALVHFSPGNEIRIRTKAAVPLKKWTHITATYDGSSRADGLTIYLNGERADCETVRDHLYRDIVYRADWGDDTEKDNGLDGLGGLPLTIGSRTNDAAYTNGRVDEFQFFDRQLSAPEARQIALQVDTSQPADWLDWYLRELDGPWREHAAKLHDAREKENELSGEALDVMVMKEMPGARRESFVHPRGEWNRTSDRVEPDVPAAILPFGKDLPRNRLGFAKWLLDPAHPLTTRVAVNRFWQLFFNRGLVSTPEDFGVQGQPPSHPELLDSLAVSFRESGWDVKAMCRRLVLSATYRQSSTPADKAAREKDPDNTLLSRGPRGRLPAEAIRDLALAASGLLVTKEGGPSVKPYQPARLWEESGTQHAYVQDHGEGLYRRSLYSFWRRSLPPPGMTIFDSPTREFCKVRRDRTDTPLQALVLMNDPQFIEAARVLAEKLVRAHATDSTARVREAWRLLTGTTPGPEQLKRLTAYLDDERARAAAAPAEESVTLLKENGEHPPDTTLPAPEVAATTEMVRLLFGFSETIMKP